MADNKFTALLQVMIDKAQAKSEIRQKMKELQNDAKIQADIKIGTSELKAAQKELDSFKRSLKEVENFSGGTKFQDTMSKNIAKMSEAKKQALDLARALDSVGSSSNKSSSSINSQSKSVGALESAFNTLKSGINAINTFRSALDSLDKIKNVGRDKMFSLI